MTCFQNGFFQSKNELKTLFKDSFIFNKPKDVLSGDFYWFVQKGDHKIIVVADCTGHGVPGAMLTVLGHNAVNEIVNVQGEVVPSRILSGLNRVIKNTFSKNPENLEYGMDITVVSIHKNEREMVMSIPYSRFSGFFEKVFLITRFKPDKIRLGTTSP
jgi:serine phosphatase RsbU (regulator of sigma subunit)